jgi:hypothetical protein
LIVLEKLEVEKGYYKLTSYKHDNKKCDLPQQIQDADDNNPFFHLAQYIFEAKYSKPSTD